MSAPSLAAMDLNLLVVLDALLAEQSVSRAARRLNATQPAVSRALGRLRGWYGDPLLTRTRHGMVPTPVALALAPEVRVAIEHIERLVERRETFDPATSRRTFLLTMSEYSQYVVGQALLPRLLAAAPHVDIDVLPWSLSFPESLESGALDIAVCPPISPVPGLHAAELISDDLVVVVRVGHPAARERLTLERFAALTHLQSAPNGRAGSVIDDLLEAAGLSRRIALRVPSTVALPAMVAASDCCATVPARFAADMARPFGLAVLPLPIDAPGISLHLHWHDRAHRDPGNVWLRRELRACFTRAPRPQARAMSRIDLSRRAKQTL